MRAVRRFSFFFGKDKENMGFIVKTPPTHLVFHKKTFGNGPKTKKKICYANLHVPNGSPFIYFLLREAKAEGASVRLSTIYFCFTCCFLNQI